MRKLIFPKPSPDGKAYVEMQERGFARFPRRLENYQRFKTASKASVCGYAPIKMDIENVSRCNLACDMCQVATFKGHARAADLSFDDFKQILDELSGVFEIKIQGLGEPFLGNDFIKMVEYASEKDIWVRTTTNATPLHLNDNYKKIIDANVGEIQISIDGVRKETYEAIRVNASFARVVENCKLINAYCDSLGQDKTRMWVLLQERNFTELHHFPQFARDLGFKRLTISMDLNGWGIEAWEHKNAQKRVSDRLTQGDIETLLDEARSAEVELTFWDITTKYSRENPCPWPFERAFISSDKNVVPCCLISNPGVFSFGVLGDFEKIWTSVRYQDFRRAHLMGAIPPACRYCYKNIEK